jgi:hypothetical protein
MTPVRAAPSVAAMEKEKRVTLLLYTRWRGRKLLRFTPADSQRSFAHGGSPEFGGASAMSWDAWAAIGQLIGAAAVIASLIFVGVQVRQSVRASKATAFQELVSSIIEVNIAHISNPELLEIIDRAGKGEVLNGTDHRLYVTLVLAAARLAQSAHYQMQLGLLDKSKLESVTYNLVRHLKTDTGKVVWAELGQRSDPEFRAYVDALIERTAGYETLLAPHHEEARQAN